MKAPPVFAKLGRKMLTESPVRIEPFKLNPPDNSAAISSEVYSPGALAALIYLAFALLVGALDILYILHHYIKFPFGDYWIWLARLYEKGFVATLYSQFNEHRLVMPGLFYFLDHRYFGSTNTLTVVVQILMQAGCAVLVSLPICGKADIPKAVRYVFAGFVVITMFWFIQAEDFFYPYICFFCCNIGILTALHLYASLARRQWQPRNLGWVESGVIISALWANFSYGHGILIWPVLIFVSFVLRLRKQSLVTILAAFVCALVLYFFNYTTPGGSANPLESLRHPIYLAHYLVLMVGLPFVGLGVQDIRLSTSVASHVISTSGILLAIILFGRFVRMRTAQKSKEQIIYCSLMAVSLGSCFITALGRSRFPVSQALSGRYSPVPLLFWISLAGMITTYLCSREVHGGIGRWIWCGVLVLASLTTLSTQRPMGRYMAGRERAQAAAALSITVGVPDMPRISQEMTPVFERILFVDRRATPFVGHSLFARPEADLLGKPLLDRFHLASAQECLGFVDQVNWLPAPASNGVRLLGWSWDARRSREVSGILVVDVRNIIRGLGITHVFRPDVAAAYSNRAMAWTGWYAYARLARQEPDTLTVFADLAGGNSVCQIGTPRVPMPSDAK